jgi:hypothetical protein
MKPPSMKDEELLCRKAVNPNRTREAIKMTRKAWAILEDKLELWERQRRLVINPRVIATAMKNANKGISKKAW